MRSYLTGANAGARAVNFLSAFREVKVLALAVTLTNIGGVAYGVYYYWQQLHETPLLLIPFVPDSPTGPFLMVIVYALWWFRGRTRSPTLELFAFVSLLKYGAWTVTMFWLYRDYFFAPDIANFTSTLLWLHLGEGLEAGILLKGMVFPSPRPALAAAAWFGAGDFADYVLGTHPRLPVAAPEFLAVPFVTVALTFICYLGALRWCRHLAHLGTRTPADPPGARHDHEESPEHASR